MCWRVANEDDLIGTVAIRDYKCMAYEWIEDSDLSDYELTFKEKRQIVNMRKRKGMILRGEEYVAQFMAMDGDVYVYRANKEMDDICIKYDIQEC